MSGDKLTCWRCGRSFIWSFDQQRALLADRRHPPRYCQDCRSHHKHELDSGMRSEVGPLAPFTGADDQRWEQALRQAQPPSAQLPEPSPNPRSVRAPHPAPNRWPRRSSNRSAAIVLWVIVVLIAYSFLGWLGAVAVAMLGMILYVWIDR